MKKTVNGVVYTAKSIHKKKSESEIPMQIARDSGYKVFRTTEKNLTGPNCTHTPWYVVWISDKEFS